jgi:hypothetical protein
MKLIEHKSNELGDYKKAPAEQVEMVFMKNLFISIFCFFLCLNTDMAMAQTPIYSGTTGDCTWEITGSTNNYTLTIKGNGAMGNYGDKKEGGTRPEWESYVDLRRVYTVIIEDGVTTVGDWAFCPYFDNTSIDNYSILSVTIGNSVKTIGKAAFYRTRLTSINIPNSVETIDTLAFYHCHHLASVTFGNSVKTIGYRAFEECFDLASVDIPNSVTTIGDRAFYRCYYLVLTLGNSVETIGNRAFDDCYYNLTSVDIPNSVKTIGDRAFYNCHHLASLTLGNSVETIGSDAFYGCPITSPITIPNSVETIGGNAFAGTDIPEVHVSRVTPLTIPYTVFHGTDRYCTLYVPCGSVAAYKKATGWSGFKDYQTEPASKTATAADITSAGTTICYNETATLSASAPSDVQNPVFRWYESQDATAPVLKTGATFTTPALTATTKYYVSFYEEDIYCENLAGDRKEVTVTVNPVPTVNIISDVTVCSEGSVSQISFSSTITSPTVTYSWSADANYSSVGLSAQTGTGNITAFTAKANTGTATISTTITVTPKIGNCTGSAKTFKITIASALSAGAISKAQTICSGKSPATLTSTTAGSGGTGTNSYQWQSSTDNNNWNDISGATSATYGPGTLTTDMYYRRGFKNDCGTVYTTSVKITIASALSAGAISKAQTICSGKAPATLTSTTAGSGGTGTNSYQWQSSTDNNNWNDISGATSETYGPGTLTTDMYYRRGFKNDCGTVYTTSVKITIASALSAGAIGSAQTICSGKSPATLTSTKAGSG